MLRYNMRAICDVLSYFNCWSVTVIERKWLCQNSVFHSVVQLWVRISIKNDLHTTSFVHKKEKIVEYLCLFVSYVKCMEHPPPLLEEWIKFLISFILVTHTQVTIVKIGFYCKYDYFSSSTKKAKKISVNFLIFVFISFDIIIYCFHLSLVINETWNIYCKMHTNFRQTHTDTHTYTHAL